MSKVTIPIIAILFLVSAFLGYQIFVNNRTISELTANKKELTSQLSQAEIKLNTSQAELLENKNLIEEYQSDMEDAQKEIDEKQETISSLKRTITQLSNENDKIKCSTSLSASEISASTNQGLTDAITKAVENDYGFTSISTTFRTVWNNSKTAIFTIKDPDRASVEVVVSWDFNTSRVNGIYNINSACMYFIR